MSLTRNFLGSIAAASAFIFTPLAQAAENHVHGGDIVVDVQAGKLTITSGEAQAGTGYKIFEGAFTTLTNFNRWTTDDPGFDMEPGTLTQGDQLWVRGLGGIKSWNSATSTWVASVPGNELIQLQDALNGSWVFRPSAIIEIPGFNQTGAGAIAESNASGQIHKHLDFHLLNSAANNAQMGTPVADGAYLIQLQLFSPTTAPGGGLKYFDSDPFFIAFNRGMDDVAFESAVEVLAVPEPSAALMLLPALGIIAWRIRRQSLKS
jgi:hypothetical protein